MAPVEIQGEVNTEVADGCCVRCVLYLVPLTPCVDGRGGGVRCVGLIVGFGGVKVHVVEVEEGTGAFNEGDEVFAGAGACGYVVHVTAHWHTCLGSAVWGVQVG